MILRFILWWISRPRSLYETETVYWKVRKRILISFPWMRDELNGNVPIPYDCHATVPPYWNSLLECTSETCHRPLPCPVHNK